VNGLVETFRYKTWATLRLIEYCQGLGDEDLDAWCYAEAMEMAQKLPAT
jgi:uncharacterized damage-inducible protein DinB